MRETETKTTVSCDDCGKSSNIHPFHGTSIVIGDKLWDMCHDCIQERVKYSIKDVPVGRICEYCKGKAFVKEYGAYGYSSEFVTCEDCKGTGKNPLL